ncbi:hypothetical protein BC936DRAFT_147304 [Jimgerdemannia flammicorona]|uniref:Uncharacterized protein n=1 Tax=Jimgerdemannia flammicorona TaxID=994334 RepID=A0A433D5N6_9FUNG|nr:hypothetical protein BC936DRAFT_147304 [Jimgerdemannia flammicorona]
MGSRLGINMSGYPYLAPIPSGYPLLPHYHELMVHYAQQQQLAAVLAHANTNLPAPAVPAVPDNNPVALAERRARRSSAVWLAIKLVFMLFVLGQNASIERIIVLHVVAIVIFLYQTERLRFVVRRIGVVPREEVNAAAAPPAPQPAAAPAPTRTEPAPHNPDAGAPAQEPAATEPTAEQSAAVSTPAPVSRLRQVEHALYTFVASLIPTAPDPVAAAAQQEEMGGGF